MKQNAKLWQAIDVLILLAVLGFLWQILYLYAGKVALSSPSQTIVHFFEMLADPTFYPHLEETSLAVLQGLAIAVIFGLAIGLIIGLHRLSGEVAEPIFVAIYSIPKITLYPIILLFFGTGMSSKVAFGAIHGIIPIIIFTMNAMRNINPVYLRTAKVMRLSKWDLARTILFPAALPEIFTGLRVGFALTLVGTLMGEMFGSQRGLGFLLMIAMGRHEMIEIMTITLLLVLFAVVVSLGLLAIDKRLRKHSL